MPKKIKPLDPSTAINFLNCLSGHRLVILDFDETIFLRNSTEEYLNSLRPRALGAIMLLILDILQPWQWLPGPVRGAESRDWVRVMAATIVFPWTWWVWRRRSPALMRQYENHELAAALAGKPGLRVIIATHGFRFIVNRLARHLSIPFDGVVGCRFFRGLTDRQQGKEQLVQRTIDFATMADGILITDSPFDLSMLQLVESPLLAQWPGARYIPALSDAYFPFFYLEFVKRPGQSYTRWMIVETQLVILVLAFSWLSPVPPLHVFGLVFMLISFWSIYEIGYFENDRVAELYERSPVLSSTYDRNKHRMSIYQAWLFALITGYVGICLLQAGELLDWTQPKLGFSHLQVGLVLTEALATMAAWIGILISTRLIYAVYNYADEKLRIWLYPVLQGTKYLAFLIVAHTSVAGAILLIAQIFSDWIPYLVYRCGGRREQVDEQILRLFVFVFLAALASFLEPGREWFRNWQTVAIMAWLLVRGKNQIVALLRLSHPVWRK